MKSSDEIKKDLEDAHKSCYLAIELGDPLGYPTAVYASYEATGNGLSLIQQFEGHLREATKKVEQLEARAHQLDLLNVGLLVEKAQLEAERDALLKYLTESHFAPCDICKHDTGDGVMGCERLREIKGPCFEWCGLQKEE